MPDDTLKTLESIVESIAAHYESWGVHPYVLGSALAYLDAYNGSFHAGPTTALPAYHTDAPGALLGYSKLISRALRRLV